MEPKDYTKNEVTPDALGADAPAPEAPESVPKDAAPTPDDAQRARKRAKRKRLIAAASVLVVVALVFAAFALFATPPSDWLEPSAKQGRYEGWDEKSIREDLDRQVEEGMMAVSVSSSIVFENGQAEGEARIENIPGNRVDQKVTITLDDTGEEVYASKALEPGTHVQTIRLSRDLEPGDYPATVMFTGYDRETHAQRGSAGVQVTLYVLN